MKRIFQISLGIMLSVFCLMLVSCKGNEQPADHQVTEIVPAATGTAETEPEQTTVSVPVTAESETQTQASRTETTTTAERTTTERTTTESALTEPTSATVTEMPVSTESTATESTENPEPVRVIITPDEIMAAAGIPLDEMLVGALDVENTEADTGNVLVSRERLRTEQDENMPEWLFRVTEIAVEGVINGQSVTVTGIAIDNEFEAGIEPEGWYVARKIPFTITKTAGN
ncbi:MAG: hypothetical protein IKI58_06885 [Oscillospiraceae bacterium]|nr:hypothetical protein [Oscillospiraceae bacterium]